jgi:hypothetical protein
MKIFVQIASYRDPELLPTIIDCVSKSKSPENLTFGICRQFHEDDKFDDLSEYENDERFRILNIPYNLTKGVCWARNQVQQLYKNEDYTLQIDSHMRFEKNWDEELINMVRQLQNKGHKKPLLTAYVSSYNPQNDPDGRVNVPWRMVFDKYIPEGAVFFLPETIPNWETLTEPVRSRFYSAHFCFTLGEFSNEVQHNPDFYFHGEEISIAVRAFTHGYDLFHPHKVLLWHEYTRNGRTKHWDDEKDWWKSNEQAHDLNRKLFGMDGNELMDQKKYGFGNVRSLKDYEKYSGLLFSKRAVQKYTLEKKYPPNPYDYKSEQEWIDSFSFIFRYCIETNKNNFELNDYDFWAILFLDINGKELFRKDCDEIEIKNKLNHSENIKICREFNTTIKPYEWVIWPHSKTNGWVNKLTGKI